MGRTFGEVTHDIMADIAALHEAVLAPPKAAAEGGKGNRQRPQRRGDCRETEQERQQGRARARRANGGNANTKTIRTSEEPVAVLLGRLPPAVGQLLQQ